MVTYRCYRVCVSKPWLPAGETFKKWIENPRNMYIGPNLSKYSGGSLIDSEWSPTEIFQKHKDLSIASKLFYYEKWVREEKMSNILQLAGMRLGCFLPHFLQRDLGRSTSKNYNNFIVITCIKYVFIK